jgi:hypothetical protein
MNNIHYHLPKFLIINGIIDIFVGIIGNKIITWNDNFASFLMKENYSSTSLLWSDTVAWSMFSHGLLRIYLGWKLLNHNNSESDSFKTLVQLSYVGELIMFIRLYFRNVLTFPPAIPFFIVPMVITGVMEMGKKGSSKVM